MTEKEQLEKLDTALGKLAPKGTWLSEVLENIWHSESTTEAIEIAKKAEQVFKDQGIIQKLWIGDR